MYDVLPSTLEQSRKELLAAGYVEAPPPWVSAAALRIDARAAWKSECPCCGKRGMDFFPFHRVPGSYVGLAECFACGHVEII